MCLLFLIAIITAKVIIVAKVIITAKVIISTTCENYEYCCTTYRYKEKKKNRVECGQFSKPAHWETSNVLVYQRSVLYEVHCTVSTILYALECQLARMRRPNHRK